MGRVSLCYSIAFWERLRTTSDTGRFSTRWIQFACKYKHFRLFKCNNPSSFVMPLQSRYRHCRLNWGEDLCYTLKFSLRMPARNSDGRKLCLSFQLLIQLQEIGQIHSEITLLPSSHRPDHLARILPRNALLKIPT